MRMELSSQNAKLLKLLKGEIVVKMWWNETPNSRSQGNKTGHPQTFANQATQIYNMEGICPSQLLPIVGDLDNVIRDDSPLSGKNGVRELRVHRSKLNYEAQARWPGKAKFG